MHMPDIYLSPSVYLPTLGLGALAVAGCAWRANRELDERKVPLMGVMGAFVFAAQMVNFPILSGVSGHLGGAVLLACLVGPYLGLLVMASILIVQALIFQDGGLLALGANILNIGAVPCFVGYGLFQALKATIPGRLGRNVACFVAAAVAIVAGAACAGIEIHLSGKNPLSFRDVMLALVGVHALIGLVEGLITVVVLNFVLVARPEVVAAEVDSRYDPRRMRRFTLAALLVSLLVGAWVSNYASTAPDGLEYVGEHKGIAKGQEEQAVLPAPLPDYSVPGLADRMPKLSTAVAGALGTLVTFGLCLAVSVVLCRKTRPVSE